MDRSCVLYCEGICCQTVTFAVPFTTGYENMVMEVTSLDTGVTVEFPGYFENITLVLKNVEKENKYENYVYLRRKYYPPIIPFGKFPL